MNKEAHAKINLSLDILGRRSDGYHEVRMIMQSLELCDSIMLGKLPDRKIELLISGASGDIPAGPDNLMVRAAQLLMDTCGLQEGVRMRLEKRIPASAGLAGGSADAAAVLTGINELFELGYSREQLMELGVRLGADIPYCILGGTALSEGIGEVLTPVSTKLSPYVLLVKPKQGNSTPQVYLSYDRAEAEGSVGAHPDVDAMLRALGENDFPGLCRSVGNVLEYAVIPSVPLISEIKRDMLDAGAAASCMTGSGSTVFGLFEDAGKLRQAAESFRNAPYVDFLSDVIESKFRNNDK